MRQNVPLTAFNRGIISRHALARTEVNRVALSAEEQTNWMPKKLGPMSLRPGLGYIGGTRSNLAAKYLPFVFAVDDTALVELTSGMARFWVGDALVTFPAVSTTVANGDFTADLASWTDADEAGATSVWAAGRMSLTGDGTNQAIRYQQVSVAAGDVGKVHAIKVVVVSGDCVVRVGSTLGGQEYVSDAACKPGTVTLAFAPTAAFYIQVMTSDAYPALVESINITTGVLEVPTPWTTQAHLSSVRMEQSGDVLFVACEGVRQQRIERRALGGWGIVDYVTYDGPFLVSNATPTRLSASGVSGPVTITATDDVFKPGHVGALFSMTTKGQKITANLIAEDTYTGYIRVTGAGTQRAWIRVISGTWVGTLTLQRSLGEPGLWEDVASVVNGTVGYNDGLDNQVVYYRIGFKLGDYTSGTATVELNYSGLSVTIERLEGIRGYTYTEVTSYTGGTTRGAFRVTGYTSPTEVSANMVLPISSTDTTDEWAEGAWSTLRGFPSAVSLYDGRLSWAGKGTEWLSITDNYHSFDIDFLGDAGPIIRSIGAGPVDSIRWLVSSSRLIAGGGGAEYSARSSSLDEPVTPTNFNMKAYTSRGSANVDAVKIDQSVVFVDRSGHRVYILTPDPVGNHAATEATVMCPDVALPSVTRMAAQRNPDTRLHCVRSDGKVAVMVYDQVEDVNAWMLVETDGTVEDVVALPAAEQDEVYYVVRRTVNGATVRYLEKWAHDADCTGGPVNKQADAFLRVTNSPASATIAGLVHLVGESVVCWADGKDVGTFVVSAGGEITLPSAVSQAIVGLTYRARFKSVKLAHAAQGGTALTQAKRVDHLALILADTHYQGLRYGPDFDTLDELPMVEEGIVTPADTVWAEYDQESVEFGGTYDTDARICLEAQAPRPCTVLGVVISVKTNDKL